MARPTATLAALPTKPAFTLIEILVVVAVLAVLTSTLLPGLVGARALSRDIACASNIRQLALGNQIYAQDQADRYCPGAPDFLANLTRWHGTRPTPSAAFESEGGPLIPYVGTGQRIRTCPSFEAAGGGFEVSSGGYGYNNDYLGVYTATHPDGAQLILTDFSGAAVEAVGRPAATVMFTDSAFAAHIAPMAYSFAHPRFQPAMPEQRYDPSIHFRHADHANIAWADGHVDRHPLTFTWSSGLYPKVAGDHNIGWFAASDDNARFDLN